MYILFFFFFNDTATTEIYTLSLHVALPISFSPSADRKSCTGCTERARRGCARCSSRRRRPRQALCFSTRSTDRKSTRLNSSHSQISYAVFCLKKKKQKYVVRHSSASNSRSD